MEKNNFNFSERIEKTEEEFHVSRNNNIQVGASNVSSHKLN